MSLSDSLSVVFSPQAVALAARHLADALLAVSVRHWLYFFIAATFFLVIAVLASACVFPRRYLYDLNGQRLPGPPAKFVLGHGALLRDYLSNTSEGILKMIEQEKWPTVMALQLPGQPSNIIGVLSDPSSVKAVLTASYRDCPKPPKYQSMECVLGKGLVTNNGESWKRHRTLLNPTFHANNLKEMSATFAQHTHELIQLWKDQLQASKDGVITVDVHQAMYALTGDIICDAGFGYQLNAKRMDEQSELVSAIDVAVHEMNQRFRDLFPWIYMLQPNRRRKFNEAKTKLSGIVQRILDQRRIESEQKAAGQPIKPRRMDLLDLLMQARDGDGEQGTSLTDAEILDETFTFLGAGFETTANMLSWTLYELGLHPEVVSKLEEELRSVVGDREVLYDDVNQLDYVQMVLKESLRLHPPVALFARRLPEAPTDVGGYLLSSAVCRVVVNVRALHRNPNVWSKPLEFLPERFAKTEKIDPHAFIPFSAGPRMCIGQRFAMIEGVLILATVLQHFSFELVDKSPKASDEAVTMRPKGGVVMRLRKRDS